MTLLRPSARFLLVLNCVLVFAAVLQQAGAVQLPLRWRWSNPEPHGNTIFELGQANGQVAQLCERGQLYASSDLNAWQAQATGTTASLRSFTLFGNQIIITGEKGLVLSGSSFSTLRLTNLRTSDWLEGVAASSNVVVAVGDNGAIYTSADGQSWQRQTGFTHWFRSVAYGNGVFYAVGETGAIVSSLNGTNWESRSSGVTVDLNKIAFINNTFWIVGNSGTVLTNTARNTWSLVPVGSTNNLFAVAGSSNAWIVAGESELRLKEGQAGWVSQTGGNNTFPAPAWTYYAALWDGDFFLVAGRNGMFVEGFKTNASSPMVWAPASESERSWFWGVTRTPDFYAAVGSVGTIMTSTNGSTWELESPPSSIVTETFLGIGGNTNVLVAAGEGGILAYSPNAFTNVVSTNSQTGLRETNTVNTFGIVWRRATSNTTQDLQGVTQSGPTIVVTGGQGTILTSEDGANWTTRLSGVTRFLSSVTAFPGGFVAVGDAGTILTSANAVLWTQRSLSTTNWIYQVRFVGNQLIAVGENGLILTSPNGINWTVRTSGTTRWLNDVTLVGDTYVIGGTQGILLTSANAIDWAATTYPSSKSIYGLAQYSGQLVTVGLDGAILRAQAVPLSDPIKFIDYARQGNDNIFLVAGKQDQVFILQKSADLRSWTDGPELEITESSGTLLFIETSNGTPSQFFKARLAP